MLMEGSVVGGWVDNSAILSLLYLYLFLPSPPSLSAFLLLFCPFRLSQGQIHLLQYIPPLLRLRLKNSLTHTTSIHSPNPTICTPHSTHPINAEKTTEAKQATKPRSWESEKIKGCLSLCRFKRQKESCKRKKEEGRRSQSVSSLVGR